MYFLLTIAGLVGSNLLLFAGIVLVLLAHRRRDPKLRLTGWIITGVAAALLIALAVLFVQFVGTPGFA